MNKQPSRSSFAAAVARLFGTASRRTLIQSSRKPATRSKRPQLQLELLEDRITPTVNLISSYNGLNFGDTAGFVPPDTCGAAGSGNTYVETVNQTIGIYSPKATGATVITDDLNDFFFTQGGLPRASGSSGLSDPIVVWDEQIGRFIVGDQDVDFGAAHVSTFDIAVSKSADPDTFTTADWFFTQVTTTENTGNSTRWDADYPGNFGWNHDAFVFTLNMFPVNPTPPGTFHVQVVALDAIALAAGTPPVTTRTDFAGGSLRPTVMHDSVAGDSMWLVSEAGTGTDITVVRMNTPLASPTFTPFTLAVTPYSGTVSPLEPDGSTTTTNIDSRILKAAEANKIIVATHSISNGAGDRDLARWYEISVTNNGSTGVPSIADQGNVTSAATNAGSAGVYDVYPAIDINSSGEIGMTFMQSGTGVASEFVSVYVTGRQLSDPAGTMQTPVLVQAGVTNYADFASPQRQGDLSGISVDTDGSFWIVNEFADGEGPPANWGTAIAQFLLGTTDVALDGAGNLVITDVVPAGKDDLLDISISGTNLRVHDPNAFLISHPGETLVDAHTIDVPLASITGNIQVNTLNGTDSLTVDSANGNPIVAGGAIFNGGNGTDTIGSSGNADYGLTDTKLTVGNRMVTLNAVEAADLKGGAASNTFTVSNWTLTAKLDGKDGGDVYIINFKGSGAGSVDINDTGASGTDKATFNGGTGGDNFVITKGTVKLGSEKVTFDTNLEEITLDGKNGDDTFTFDNASGLIADTKITAKGGAGTNTLTIKGNAGIISRETHTVTGGAAGTIVFDPDDSGGAGAAGPVGSDAEVIAYTEISQVDDLKPADRLDFLFNRGPSTIDNLTIGDGPPVSGLNTTQVTGAGPLQQFSNKGVLSVGGVGGADTITVNLTAPGDLLTSIELYGNDVSRGRVRADDNASDTFNIKFNTIPVLAFGQGGDDDFNISSNAGTDTLGNLASILADVTVNGGAGGANHLVVSDFSGAAHADVHITSSQISGLAPTAGVTIDYSVSAGGNFTNGASNDGIRVIGSNIGSDTFTVESTLGGSSLKIEGGGGTGTFIIQATGKNSTLTASGGAAVDTFNVTSTGTGSNTSLDGMGSGDQFNIGSTPAANNGRLNGIAGKVTVLAGDGADSLYINDRGTPLPAKFNYIVTNREVINDAIMPRPFAGVFYDNSLEDVRLDGTDGINTFSVAPSLDTAIYIDGNLPPFGTSPGDVLKIFANPVTSGATLTPDPVVPGNGMWTFTNGLKTVTFESIEDSGGSDGSGNLINPFSIVAIGTESNTASRPLVEVYDTQTNQRRFSFQAYENLFKGGVRVATGDVDGDGVLDIITAPGKGRAPLIKVYSGINGMLSGSFLAYGASFLGGVYIASADVNGDKSAEIITGAGPGWLPMVKVFNGNNAFTDHALVGSAFLPFNGVFKGGVRVAAGDFTGDRQAEVIISSGGGMAATVGVFQLQGGAFQALETFRPFGAAFTGGVYLAVGDYDGDGIRDVIVSAGNGWMPQVRVFSGANLTNSSPLTVLDTFFAFETGYKGGVRVAARPMNGDDPEEVSQVKLYIGRGTGNNGRRIRVKTALSPALVDAVFAGGNFAYGVYVG